MSVDIQDYSPYAPIRLRQLFWWKEAQNFASQGFVMPTVRLRVIYLT